LISFAVVVLKEGTTESKGRQAWRNNITAAKLIAEQVKSALVEGAWTRCSSTVIIKEQ
jgi:hypothetical protein